MIIFQLETPDESFYGDIETFDALMREEKWVIAYLQCDDGKLTDPCIVRTDCVFSVSYQNWEDEEKYSKLFLEIVRPHTCTVSHTINIGKVLE